MRQRTDTATRYADNIESPLPDWMIMRRRPLYWTLGTLLTVIVLIALALALLDWNWMRGPIGRKVTEMTGREFVIKGPLEVKLRWPLASVHAQDVSFANPPWARERQMFTVANAHILLDLSQLIRRKLYIPEAHLGHPVVNLEKLPDGRRNWLLDKQQRDEKARVPIGRLALDEGRLIFDEVAAKTHIELDLSTIVANSTAGSIPGDLPVIFKARGQFHGTPLDLKGSGGPVLSLHDETTPYPLKMTGRAGPTTITVDGMVTSLSKLSALDMKIKLGGKNVADLYTLFGAALPQTGPYNTAGHLIRQGKSWRYENFTGVVGKSDIAGNIQVDLGGKRPQLTADLNSRALLLSDLGPAVGTKPGGNAAQVKKPAGGRVLPEMPFSIKKWDTIDADVTLRAKSLKQTEDLPLEDLTAHAILKDQVLTLDPLDFGIAGGDIKMKVKLEGQKDPIHAELKGQARKLLLARLVPGVQLSKTSIGQINGDFELSGTGNSVGRMLATSNGKVAMVVAGGEISRMMMEMAGLHLPEILMLKLTGDQVIRIHCGIADFAVKGGVMHTNTLVFDTQVTRIDGTGTIDLQKEQLNLTLQPNTKKTSLASLQSPIYMRGSFSRPEVKLDKTAIATRALGAIALGIVNPFLALLPLVETGPGMDSDCGKLVKTTQARIKP